MLIDPLFGVPKPMTYCLGLALDEGLVMAADSRTNAGIDYVTTYSKLHVFQPALDRIATPSLSLEDAARLCLVSLDATSRSNVTVGPPYEVAIYAKDSFCLSHRLKLSADHPALRALSASWNQGIRNAFDGLPRFDWEAMGDAPSGVIAVSQPNL